MAKDKKNKGGGGNKYAVDFNGYEERSGSGYDGDVPKRGIYTAELVSCSEHQTSDTAIEWIFEITEGDYKGWRGWTYSDMDNALWRTQQVVKAINGGKEEGMVLDPASEKKDGPSSKTVKAAKKVRIQLKRETYEDEPRAKISRVMPLEAGDTSSEKKGKKKKKGDDPF